MYILYNNCTCMYICICSCIMISIPQSTDDKLVKIDYITQFSQWLHTNNYSTQYVMDHLQWAVELLAKGGSHCAKKFLNCCNRLSCLNGSKL